MYSSPTEGFLPGGWGRAGMLVVPFRGYIKSSFVPLWVFSLKTSTAEAFVVHLRVLSQKTTTGDCVM